MKHLNASSIIGRARQFLSANSDSELAEKLGISQSTVANWKARNSIDFDLLFDRCNGVDFHWLLTGQGAPKGALGKYDHVITPEILSAFNEDIAKLEAKLHRDFKTLVPAVHANIITCLLQLYFATDQAKAKDLRDYIEKMVGK